MASVYMCVRIDGSQILCVNQCVWFASPLFNGGEGGGVNFNYLTQRGESDKLKKGVEVWCRGIRS